MSCGLRSTKNFFRGGSVYWNTTFYDQNNIVLQPSSAYVNIDYPDTTGSRQVVEIQMTPPVFPAVFWTALLDTRNMGIGPVNWSIHSSGFPAAVDEGTFTLTANSANLVNFP